MIAHWLHSNPIIDRMKLGFIGVDFFFVISGFLISLQLFQLNDSITQKHTSFWEAAKSFWIRRALRIFPLYYLVVILATLFNDNELRDALIYNLTYTSNFYFIKTQHWTSTFSHFWSLSVEEFFYLGWPLIALTLNKKTLMSVIALIAAIALIFRYI